MMGRRRRSSDGYRSGDWWVTDHHSGFQIRASDTVKQWNGLLVHWAHSDPKHPQELVRGVADRQTVPFSSPEPDDTFIGVPTLTFKTSSVSSSDLDTYTFSSLSIGTASTTRLVIAVCFAQNDNAAAGVAPTSVTIGGVAATIHVSGLGTSANESSVAIASAVVPTGTTASVVVVYPDSQARAGVAVYTLTGYESATPIRTGSNTADAKTTASLNMVAFSTQVGVVGSSNRFAGSTTCTWTNATEASDEALESSQGSASSAYLDGTAGVVEVLSTWDQAGDLAIAGAVWQ